MLPGVLLQHLPQRIKFTLLVLHSKPLEQLHQRLLPELFEEVRPQMANAPSVPHVWPRERLLRVLLKFSDGLHHPGVAIMDYADIRTCPNYSLLQTHIARDLSGQDVSNWEIQGHDPDNNWR